MMENKEIFLRLAQAYIDQYKFEVELDAAFLKFGIDPTNCASPLPMAIEKLIEDLSPIEIDWIELLINLAENGFVTVTYTEEDGYTTDLDLESVEELYAFFIEVKIPERFIKNLNLTN